MLDSAVEPAYAMHQSYRHARISARSALPGTNTLYRTIYPPTRWVFATNTGSLAGIAWKCCAILSPYTSSHALSKAYELLFAVSCLVDLVSTVRY